jgi:hypothetical protein
MIKFKNIIETASPEKLDFTVTIEGHPVWDYKAGGINSIFLISEDPWQGVEDEYVTLGELRKYIVSCEIPFDLVEFKTEADRELLKSFTWENKQLNFSHY